MTSNATILIDGKPFDGLCSIVLTSKPESASPTGREPRILWSSEWQERWERAAEELHPWTEWLQFAVDNPASAYFDKDLFPTIAYQLSGAGEFARQACEYLVAESAKPLSGDKVRANWLTWLVCYEWLYPALSEAELDLFGTWMDECTLFSANTPLADSDRLVTAYLGIKIWRALSRITNPDIADVLVRFEERLVEYAKLSAGGDWIEGAYYSTGTMTTLVLGLLACEDLGIPVPAELAALPEQLATAERHRWDNTLSFRLTWGAIQPANFARTGINRGDLVLDLWAALGLGDMIQRAQAKGGYWAKPHATFFLFARPE